jgi:uncharacterized integral membrane protein (TIGR00698 family)
METGSSYPGLSMGEIDKSSIALEQKSTLSSISVIPGLLLVLAIGVAAFFLSRLHPSLDALAMAILLGIVAGIVTDRAAILLPGAQLGAKILIPVGIILYGTRLDFTRLAALPGMTIVLTVLCMATFYILILLLNRIWGIRSKTAELVASGSAVCGASAIAVLSPAMEAEPEDTSVSLLVITAVGLLGAITYPLLKTFLDMPDITYAVLSGATLHQTGIVKVAVSAMDKEIISYALAVKTVRIVMLLVIALITGLFHNRFQEGQSPLIFLRRVWFLVPFALVGVTMSFVPITREFFISMKPWATFIFSMAIGSIGFIVDIESVLTAGSRPLVIGLLGWIGVVLFFWVMSPLFF